MAKLSYRWALNAALKEEMARDPRVVVAGEDVAKPGGPFGITRGLIEEFGPLRVRDTPLSELAIAGLAVGCAAGGYRPVVEIMFMDFITLAVEQICNQAAKAHYLYGPQLRMPIVFRTLSGTGVRAGVHHSQSLEAWFVHTPGLIVVQPSTAADAKGLLKAAIRDDNPVIFMEHKGLLGVKDEVPDGDHVVALGKADVKRRGRDVTVVTAGLLVHRALAAAEELANKGIDAEVVDLRTLWPLDRETILYSVRRTGRLVVANEAPGPCSVGSEVAAMVAEQAWGDLRAPVRRVAAAHVPIPAGVGEDLVIPSQADIAAAIEAAAG